MIDVLARSEALNFFTRWYRLRFWWWRYIRSRDLTQLGMMVATGILAINTFSVKPKLALVAGVAYFFLLLVHSRWTLFSREARDHVQAEILWGLFSQMNKEIFNDDNRTRFTLFRQSPLRPDYIVPWYRYQKGTSDSIREANGSRARFRRGEGIAGKAWASAGKDLIFAPMPPIPTRDAFEKYCIADLHISPGTVYEFSDYMCTSVRTIFAYGFTDPQGRFLGVLSLDSMLPVSYQEAQGGKAIATGTALDANSMALIIRAIQNVLNSFEVADRRAHRG
jgi:hypothetical protein